MLNEKELIKLWDIFDDTIVKAGYDIIVHANDPGMSRSTVALKDDLYVPVIRFITFNLGGKDNYSFVISVEDRNGNKVLGCNKTIGYIRFSEYTEEKLMLGIKYVLDVFGQYNEGNTVPTKFNKI